MPGISKPKIFSQKLYAKKFDTPLTLACGGGMGKILTTYKFSPITELIYFSISRYPKVWIAPTMKGRFYGGGMMVTPAQNRQSDEGKVSSAVLYGAGALPTLIVFPSIFKGEHVKHTKMVDIREGHEVTVEFDRPTALQIDGETVLGVTSYTVKTGKTANKKECAAAEV